MPINIKALVFLQEKRTCLSSTQEIELNRKSFLNGKVSVNVPKLEKFRIKPSTTNHSPKMRLINM